MQFTEITKYAKAKLTHTNSLSVKYTDLKFDWTNLPGQ